MEAGPRHDLGRGFRARLQHEIVAIDEAQPGGFHAEERGRGVHDVIEDLLAVLDGSEPASDVVEDLEPASLLGLTVTSRARGGPTSHKPPT